jgi:NAD(P)-dependent dehydrogenase (short-subunit alcohol dehydrogenase family)
MTRTYAVTGAASGIGKATAGLLREAGHTVIGIDIHDADVVADLSDADSRAQMVADVTEKSGGRLDGVLAVAGLANDDVPTALVNYFGAVGTLEGLRPLLETSDAPRAVLVSSMASLFEYDKELGAAMETGDEDGVRARAQALVDGQGQTIYATSKRAVARWMRRQAPSADWAGKGIALNAVAPGMVETPMIAEQLSTPEGRKALEEQVPMPLNGIVQAEDVAEVIIWLAGAQNGHLCGQLIFVDGGSDVVIRGDSILPMD